MRYFLLFILTLLCSQANIYGQWIENFDSSSNLPSGWFIVDDPSSNFGWFRTSDRSHTPSHSYYKRGSGSFQDEEDVLVTKRFLVQDNVSDVISFYFRTRDNTDSTRFNVLASTTCNVNLSCFSDTLVSDYVYSGNDWFLMEIDLSSYEGQNVFIGIQQSSASRADDLFVDSFVVDSRCMRPTSAGVPYATITPYSASIRWEANNGESEWEVAVVPFGAGMPTSGTPVTTNPYVFTGLTPDTSYEYYVRAKCGTANYSDWSNSQYGANFKTRIACTIPTDVAVTNTSDASVQLDWTENNGESRWEIKVVLGGDDPDLYNSTVVTTNPYTIADLNTASNYDLYIRTDCASTNNGFSDWVKNSFVTNCGATSEFFQGFEGQATNAFPTCWFGRGIGTVLPNDTFVDSGEQNLKIDGVGTALEAIVYAVTPRLEGLLDGDHQFSFNIKKTSFIESYSYEVGVMTNRADESTFSSVFGPYGVSRNNPNVVFNFDSYFTTDEYIAIKVSFPYGGSNSDVYIDNVSWKIDTPLSVGDLEYDKKVTVYPIPADNVLNIVGVELVSINIYSMDGKLVLKLQGENNTINISSLNSGIYFLNIMDQNGIIHIKKIIKN